ncbi:MAG: type II toxin-antitoxin system YhaV family toxin [Cyanobacteria bacterium REEB67]|nr:type II toxin-antitoxin system YhaV family toxin [Cyanobacteria bacterium REEB67]
MQVNGWSLYQHPLFKSQFDRLLADAQRLEMQYPETYHEHKTIKLLAKITRLISDEIPSEPGHERWNQGNTLGKDHRHWKRAKFGRFRLFFRYLATADKRVIVYVWFNDENALRKAGDKNDPYAVFERGLKRGHPPDSFDNLILESPDLELNDLNKDEEL